MIPIIKSNFKSRNNVIDDIVLIPIKKPMIAITFDDGFETDYTVALPEMESRGLKGTSYILGSRVGDETYLKWQQIREMQVNSNWCVGCHTFTHINTSTASAEEIEIELVDNDTSFITNGLNKPTHLAYPYGAFPSGEGSKPKRDVIKQYRQTQRRTNYLTTDINTYDNFNMGLIKSYKADVNDIEKLNDIKQIIDYTIQEKGLLTLYLHRITDEAGDYTSATSYSFFIQVLDYVKSVNIESVTIDEMVEYVNYYNSN